MSGLSFGDLSQTFQLRRDTVTVRMDLARATQEMSSGRHADIGKAVSGDFAPLVGIDRQMSVTRGYDINAREAALFAETAQITLDRIQGVSFELAPRLLEAELSGYRTLDTVLAKNARAAFETTVSSLNAQVAGRSLFAGAATNATPLAEAGAMLASLEAAVAGETTAAGIEAVVDAWFAPGGNFDTLGYQGSATTMADFRVAEGISVAVPLKADDAAFRGQLKGLAMAALLDGGVALDASQAVELAQLAGTTLLGNQTALSTVRADLGVAQDRIEQAGVRNSSELSALEIARSEIVSADPYETAMDLRNLETQLQSIYAVTSRLAGLSLTNFLR